MTTSQSRTVKYLLVAGLLLAVAQVAKPVQGDSTPAAYAPSDGLSNADLQAISSVIAKDLSGGPVDTDFFEKAKLTTSNEVIHDNFGSNVAFDGDTMVFGAQKDDDHGKYSGSVYIFEKPPSGWATTEDFTAKLTASDGTPIDQFGATVAISGDTVIVGGFSETAYVFEKPPTGWATTDAFTAKLTASDAAERDNYGRSVAIEGGTVVVGARQSGGHGSVYVYEKPPTGWVTTDAHTGRFISSDIDMHDYFGDSVAISDNTVVVGAWADDDFGYSSGSAYVFEIPPTEWATITETAKLLPSDGAEEDYFGSHVAIDGDTIVIGAYGDDDQGDDAGSAYVFEKPGTGWANMTESAKLTIFHASEEAHLGMAVDVSGDTVLLGAVCAGIGYRGHAYVYKKPSTGWANMTESQRLGVSGLPINHGFGRAVGFDGNTLVVSKSYDRHTDFYPGSAHVFENVVLDGPPLFMPTVSK